MKNFLPQSLVLILSIALVFSTGGIDSLLFPILYFLAFGIAFVTKPFLVFIFLAVITAIFLPDALKGDVASNFLKIILLYLISPLAFFVGSIYRKREKTGTEIKATADAIAKDVEDVLKNPKDQTEKLNEILEETESLREETKV